MQSLFDFIIKPKNERYDNKKYIDGQELLVNTEISDHRYVSRTGIVLNVPKSEDNEIQIGDEVILHHNVFRRFRDIRGQEKNSRSFYEEDKYFVQPNQIFAYKRNKKWLACSGFNFIQPIKETEMFSINVEKEGIGILRFKDPALDFLNTDDLVGFRPGAEYEFVINGKKMYRVPTNQITIKYEYKGNEEEYNPGWAQSG